MSPDNLSNKSLLDQTILQSVNKNLRIVLSGCLILAVIISLFFICTALGLLFNVIQLPNIGRHTPEILSSRQAEDLYNQNQAFIWETSGEPQVVGLTSTYFVFDLPDDPVLWGWTWCTKTEKDLDQSWKDINLEYKIDGNQVPNTYFTPVDFTTPIEVKDIGFQEAFCRMSIGGLSNWSPGKFILEIEATFNNPVNDGWETFSTNDKLKNIIHVDLTSSPNK